MAKDFTKDIEACVKTLNNKGTILYPTDTVWGLGCNPIEEEAVQRIMQIKNRPSNKSFVVLVESIDRLKKIVPDIDNLMIDYISAVKKPTTIIYPNVIGFAKSVAATDNSVAIRICSDLFCQTLIRQLDTPLLSTSANKSGETTPTNFSDINVSIKTEVDYIVQYRQYDNNVVPPSTIVKWQNEKLIVIRD